MKMVQYFGRVLGMNDSRLIKHTYSWDYELNKAGLIKTWSSEVKTVLQENNLEQVYTLQQVFHTNLVSSRLKASLFEKQKALVQNECKDKPKLRTFVAIKDFDNVSPHISKPLSFLERKTVSQLRLGTLPLRLETARYLRPILPENERICYCHSGEVENELHFLFQCSSYVQLRTSWLNKLMLPDNFEEISSLEKLAIVLNVPENVKETARYLLSALYLRPSLNKDY